MDFFEKMIFFKIGKGGEFTLECVSNDINSQNCPFHLNCEAFYRKIKTNELRKIYEEYFLKNVFILKRHL